MTRFLFRRLAPFILAVALAACSGSSDNLGSGPAAPSPAPSPSPSPAPGPSPSPSTCSVSTSLPSAVSARAGAYPFALTAGSGCSWAARSDVTWADVTPGSGQGNATLLLQVQEHTRRDARTATVVINGQAFRVTQDAVGCVYTLDRATLDVADQGGQVTFMLNAASGCTWSAASSEPWISVRTPNGSGGGTIILQITANTGDVRQGFVTVEGQRLTITQRRG